MRALTVAGAMRDQWADEKATGDIAALTLQRMCGGSSFPQFHYGTTYLLFTFAIWHFGLSSNGECRSFTLPVNCVCVCVFRNALPINENLRTTVGPILWSWCNEIQTSSNFTILQSSICKCGTFRFHCWIDLEFLINRPVVVDDGTLQKQYMHFGIYSLRSKL